MSYTIELEKLTDEQLEAFKVIDLAAYKTEKENRSTYTDEDMKKFQIYTDLDRAYYYLKPMYDNMRNTEVKKTITESGILTTLEKVFRWTKKKGVKFERYTPTPATEPVKEELPDPVILPEGVTAAEIPSINIEVTEPVKAETPAFVVTPDMVKVVEDKPAVTENTVETMSMEELNKIMASIPAVEKI